MTQTVAQPLTSLPHAPILNYLARGTAGPTRVRIVAARFAGVSAALCANGAAAVLIWIVADAYALGRSRMTSMYWYSAPVIPPSLTYAQWRDALTETLTNHVAIDLVFTLFVMSTLLLLPLAALIKGGRRWPSLVGLAYFSVATGIAFLATFGIGIWACAAAGVAMPGARHWSTLTWLIGVPISAAACLLLRDVCTYLWWIARQPDSDKPLAPFRRKAEACR